MIIKHSDIEIEEENPFANCKLDRRKYAHILTDIINSYSYGFVLAINNKWGTGKTTFIKMWEQDLKNKGYQTVYFNAWENDFESNPLTALMGELKTLTKESTEPAFKSTLKKAASLTKHIAPIIVQAVADRYINTAEIRDAITGVTNGLSDLFEKDVNEYAEKKKNISEFRKNLSEFIAKTNKGKPLVFIVDELDRCRPNYAVSILEQIKHFFSVSNIVFILSIDKVQLGNAVRGVYGSDSIDADEYLRRFIDIEYSIPEPEVNLFYKYLYTYFRYFDEFFASQERVRHPELQSDREIFLQTCKLLFTNSSVTLRQQEKIFSLARLSLRSFNGSSFVMPNIFLFLIYIKIIHNSFYKNLIEKKLSIPQLQEKFLEVIQVNNNEDNNRTIMSLEANLITYYNDFLDPHYFRNKLFEYESNTGKSKLLVKSIVDNDSEEVFLSILQSINSKSIGRDLDLSYFLKRIDFLENLKI